MLCLQSVHFVEGSICLAFKEVFRSIFSICNYSSICSICFFSASHSVECALYSIPVAIHAALLQATFKSNLLRSNSQNLIHSICSTCFTVFVEFALSICSICFAVHHSQFSIPDVLGAALLEATKRTPDVFIVEITTRSGRKHEHSSEKEEEEPRRKRRSSSTSGSQLHTCSHLFGNSIKP